MTTQRGNLGKEFFSVLKYTMEEGFEKLEELVKDEDKIVTVPLYAHSANLSFEESSKLITKFLEVNNGSQMIHPTFVLNGARKDGCKISIVQVSEATLGQEKQAFQNEPIESIFSIQKSKDVNYNFISLVEPGTESNQAIKNLGAVVGKNCIKRLLKKVALPSLPIPGVKEKSTPFSKQNSLFKSKTSSEEVKTEVKQELTKESKPKPQAQNSITGLFNKAAENTKAKSVASTKTKPNKGLSSFLTKSESKETNSDESEAKRAIVTSAEKTGVKSDVARKEELFDSDTDEDILKDLNIPDNKSAPTKVEKNPPKQWKKNTTGKRTKVRKSTGDSSKPEKKRKRIIVDEGSDSDDIFGSEKSDAEDDIVEELFYEEKEQPKAIPLAPKNKRRKAVKKTYEDDEGFIVTETEYVYETASEDENEPNSKIAKQEEIISSSEKRAKTKLQTKGSGTSENDVGPNKAAAKNKKGGKNKPQPVGKQTTLINFFKKK